MSARCFIRDSSMILTFNFSRLLLFSCQVVYAFPFSSHTDIFLKIIFNLRIIVLQYCIGFFHTTAWISHKYIYVPPTWTSSSILSHPSGLSEYRVELPVLHSSFPLAICFTYCTAYVSVLLSQCVLSSPSPTVSKVCFLHLSLCSCPVNRFISTVLSRFHTSTLIHDIYFSISDLRHCITGSRFIHFTRTDPNVFLFLAE